MRYIDDECDGCEWFMEPYGCTNNDCPVYKEYEEGRAEMAADFDHDCRKENRIHPIFNDILKPFRGEE